jgi:hypothetical protein
MKCNGTCRQDLRNVVASGMLFLVLYLHAYLSKGIYNAHEFFVVVYLNHIVKVICLVVKVNQGRGKEE